MKSLLQTLLYCLISTTLYAQSDIVAMEYFVDLDPGVGLATAISVTPGADVDISIAVPTTTLSKGFHSLHIRSQNADGNWSLYESRLFYIQNADPIVIPPVSPITELEYFIDNDPGHGTAQSVSITPGTEIDLPAIVNTSALSNGFHTISFRTRNANNLWSFYETRIFYIQPPITTGVDDPVITELEYFFDDDPGQGDATAITGFTSAATIEVTEAISNGLTSGWHTFNVRARDHNGNWGFSETRPVYINESGSVTTTPSLIDRLEYFFGDNDPGSGNATAIEIDPNTDDVDIASILIPTEPTIPVGTNKITFRAQNEEGLFGFSETREFDVIDDCDQPVADFSVNLACAGEAVEFIDNSTSVQGDAEYRWYLNGDEIVDDMTTGNISFTYPNPGTYQVALAISQGQICYDSIFMDIEVKAKPIVVFNAERVEIGTPTSYIVDQFNVDPAFTWSWDFETDATIDDNTAGNTNFTFPAVSAYLTTLNVSDGLGCETTFARSVTVDAISTGGGPEANFVTSTACLGAATSFTDLSSDIPPGSTYSWDFNGNGVEDDNTVGSTQFTFPSPGVYMAELTIDTGMEIVSRTLLTSVIDIPVADFTSNTVCEGDVTMFTDLSTNLSGTAQYSWDFDGDGIEDSSLNSSTSFTYPTAGSYVAVLLIDNGSGCINTHILTVEVVDQPAAAFSFNVTCNDTEVLFINQSTNVSTSITYSWDFNDDDIIDTTSPNPTFDFHSTGDHLVSLLVDNGSGCIDEISEMITIQNTPTVDFNFAQNCGDLEVMFTDLSTGIEGTPTYAWDFDNDGNIDSSTIGDVTFTYPSSGSYIANLTISNEQGCSESALKSISIVDNLQASFTVESACAGETVSFVNTSTNTQAGTMYSWDFDNDGMEDSNSLNPGQVFNNPGTYPITLTAQSISGCTDSFTMDITISAVPLVDFVIDSSCPEDPVVFTDVSSDVEAGALYEWDFDNDGSIDSNETVNVSFTYPDNGNYSVRLRITNNGACTSELIKQVTFDNAPDVDFSFSNTCLGEVTVFTDQSSGVSSGATYSWDFDGDGIEDSNVPGSTSFEYPSAGTYNAQLNINNNGCSDLIIREVEIFELPLIDMPVNVDLCDGDQVTLDAGVGFVEYLWSDGSNNQTLVVANEGLYEVIVTDINGCQAAAQTEVLTSLLPTAGFDIVYSINEDNITIITENLSENADSFLWDFGNGQTSNESNPTYTYSDLNLLFGATYELCLTSSNSCESVTVCETINLTVTSGANAILGGVQVYPNPSSGTVFIKLPSAWKKATAVTVYDLTGSKVLNMMSEQNVIRLEGLKQGSYFIEIETGGANYIQKLLIK